MLKTKTATYTKDDLINDINSPKGAKSFYCTALERDLIALFLEQFRGIQKAEYSKRTLDTTTILNPFSG